MRKAILAVAALLILSSLTGPVAAQAFPITVNLGTALPMPIGQTNTVAVTVTDIVNSTVQLTFVGLRFEWDHPNNFYIGGNSEKGAVLAAGQQITYTIPVIVPANVTPGVHKLSTYVTYRLLNPNNATGVLAGWWVADIQFAYPQTQQPSQTATGSGPQQSFSLETIAVLLAVVAIGLFLERSRIKSLIGKLRRSKPTAVEPEGEKVPVVEKKEEDL